MENANPIEGQNTGVKWRDLQPQDDVAGGLSRVVSEIRVPDGQWDSYVPNEGDVQAPAETNTCTNNSCRNSIDTQINQLLSAGVIPQESIDWLTQKGYIVNGQHHSSAAFNAFLSLTDPLDGNFLYKPWDSARHDGMIPDPMLPFVSTGYYGRQVTPEMKALGQEWLNIFNIQYEAIKTDVDSLTNNFTHAPVSVISGVCSPWSAVVPVCDKTSGHATLLYGLKNTEYLKDFDSYIPNRKQLSWGYIISYAIKGVVILRSTKWTHTFFQSLKLGDTNEEVKALQIALFLDGVLQDSEWKTQEAVQKWGGYFGNNTEDAVKRFQAKYGIITTGRVGELTNGQLNKIYSLN